MQFDSIDAAAPASFAWSKTVLGEPAQWPHSLRLCVDILLNSPLASVLMWGPEQVMVYNDAYVALLGSKHMAAPGGKVPAMLPVEWSWNGAALESAWAGKAGCYRGETLQVWRDGNASAQLLDLYYTPIRDELGQVRGVLCAIAPGTAPARAAAAQARPLRVLVVEDNLDAQFLVCEMLMAFGHQVQAVGTGEEAAGLLAADVFDVLFTDVSLPGISGVDLARQALRERPGLQIIFASGFGDTLTKHVEFAATALQKPYDMEHLKTALERIGQQLAGRH
ncbi:CheY-like chemotaxis protein [Janthinobacterium sp. CG_23.3]|uniref:response regulator n=1 Tax=unclassified Janthinobacterium TaxID=2610881 RepID=UPI0003457D23|nr:MULTISPECIES: response regulator [unclassified Janthinobacterium]MEC5161990.1 CheY-like chemotaxis protein [Janthinobacterium sp. CG_S6]